MQTWEPETTAALWRKVNRLSNRARVPPSAPITNPYQTAEERMAADRAHRRAGRLEPADRPVDLRPATTERIRARAPVVVVWSASPVRLERAPVVEPPDARAARLALIAVVEARRARRVGGVNAAGAGPGYPLPV